MFHPLLSLSGSRFVPPASQDPPTAILITFLHLSCFSPPHTSDSEGLMLPEQDARKRISFDDLISYVK